VCLALHNFVASPLERIVQELRHMSIMSEGGADAAQSLGRAVPMGAASVVHDVARALDGYCAAQLERSGLRLGPGVSALDGSTPLLPEDGAPQPTDESVAAKRLQLANDNTSAAFNSLREMQQLIQQLRETQGDGADNLARSSASGNAAIGVERLAVQLNDAMSAMSKSAAAPSGVVDLHGGGALDEETSEWLYDMYATRPLPRDEKMQLSAEDGARDLKRVMTYSKLPKLMLGASGTAERTIKSLLETLGNWNFEIFELERLTAGRTLLFTGFFLFKKYDLLNKFSIREEVLMYMLSCVEDGYRKSSAVPYHNSTHAADVMQTMHCFLTGQNLRARLTDLDILTALIGTMLHDFDHPGVNNVFLINSNSRLATLYNKRSVLENHHASRGLTLLKRNDANILSALSLEQRSGVETTVIEMILATDMKCHFEHVNSFKTKLQVGGGFNPSVPEDRMQLLTLAIKVADIAHPAKSLALHHEWTQRLCKEFFRQGDRERKAGMPVSPFMDRRYKKLAKSQVNFIEYVVLPFFTLWAEYFENDTVISQLKGNLADWHDKAHQEEVAVAPRWETAYDRNDYDDRESRRTDRDTTRDTYDRDRETSMSLFAPQSSDDEAYGENEEVEAWDP